MNSSMRHIKGITRRNITLRLAFMLIVLMLTLSACSQKSSQNEVSVSDDTLSAPLPSALLAVDATNLVVGVVVDGGLPQTCAGLSVNQGAGTFSCTITLSGGPHNIVLVLSIIDATYGTVQVVTVSGLDVVVVPGQTVSADFSTLTITFVDDDGDGISNRDELDAGTDPSDPLDPTPLSDCILDTSLIDSCTLG